MRSNYLKMSVLLTLVSLVSSVQGQTLRTVALSNDSIPGTGGIFRNAVGPVINESGEAAGRGIFSGNTGPGFGIWTEGGGDDLDYVAGSRNPAPGIGPNATFGFSSWFSVPFLINFPLLNDTGEIAFLATYQSTSSRGTGIWIEDGGNGLELVARTGGAAPGTNPGVTFSELGNAFGNFVFNNAGHAAFYGELTGTGIIKDDFNIRENEIGIWSGGGGNGLQLIARKGSPAPGAEPDEYYWGFGEGYPVNFPLNDAGQIAFIAGLAREDQDGYRIRAGGGIWSEGGGNGLTLVVREGDIAPGVGVDSIFRGFGNLTLNNAGHLAFNAFTRSSSGDSSGVWLKTKGSELTLAVRAGSAAPGTGPGVEFATFSALDSPLLNGSGKIAFSGSLAGVGVSDENDSGIWSGEVGDGFSLIAREGSTAPGTDPGVKFSGFGTTFLNGPGQIAFVGTLMGTGIDETNDLGIWAEDLSGNLKLIVREGEQIDVDDTSATDSRRIKNFPLISGFLTSSGNEDGRRSIFNDRGQLVFSASFTDGTNGLFVSNLVAVPEPSTLWIFVLGTVSWMRVRNG